MSYSKGDSYYEAHVDDEATDHPASSDDEFIPTNGSWNGSWIDRHYDELDELYGIFKRSGNHMFGNAFFQLGTFEDFARFVYSHTIIVSN